MGPPSPLSQRSQPPPKTASTESRQSNTLQCCLRTEGTSAWEVNPRIQADPKRAELQVQLKHSLPVSTPREIITCSCLPFEVNFAAVHLEHFPFTNQQTAKSKPENAQYTITHSSQTALAITSGQRDKLNLTVL